MVQLELNDGKKISIDDDGIKLDDNNRNHLVIQRANGALTIEANGTLTIKATTIAIEASGTLAAATSPHSVITLGH